MGKKKAAQPVGRIIRNAKKAQRAQPQPYAHLYSAEQEKSSKLASVTETTDLVEFFSAAQLADRQFTAEKEQMVLLTKESFAQHTAVNDPAKEQLNMKVLRIPRRPHWDEKTSPEELDKQEREMFLEWRKQFIKVEEEENLLLSPFERNIQVWRQLWRTVERSDIVVQIVDARNPVFFYCKDLVEYVKEVDSEKIHVLLVNKADLLTEKQRIRWAEYFTSVGTEFIFWSANMEQMKLDKELLKAKARENGEEIDDSDDNENEEREEEEEEEEEEEITEARVPKEKSHIYSRSELFSYFRERGKAAIEKSGRVMVGMVGYPNVGKSSTINLLVGQKKVNVSATPGKTKHIQTLLIDEDITLCDCPGLVFPNFVSTKAEMICCGLLPIDQMRDHRGPVDLICRRIPKKVLESTYGVTLPKPLEHEDPNRPPKAEELLQAYGFIRGFMTVHGMPDESRAARLILKDFVNGKLLYCHKTPPLGNNINTSTSTTDSTNAAPAPVITTSTQPQSATPQTSSDPQQSDVFLEEVQSNKPKVHKPQSKPTFKQEKPDDLLGNNKGVGVHTTGRKNGKKNFTRVQFIHSTVPVAKK